MLYNQLPAVCTLIADRPEYAKYSSKPNKTIQLCEGPLHTVDKGSAQPYEDWPYSTKWKQMAHLINWARHEKGQTNKKSMDTILKSNLVCTRLAVLADWDMSKRMSHGCPWVQFKGALSFITPQPKSGEQPEIGYRIMRVRDYISADLRKSRMRNRISQVIEFPNRSASGHDCTSMTSELKSQTSNSEPLQVHDIDSFFLFFFFFFCLLIDNYISINALTHGGLTLSCSKTS